VLVTAGGLKLEELSEGSRIATSSLRRRAQLLRFRPDLQIESIRGNVETRIRKLLEENLNGLILAEAGIARLNLEASTTRLEFSTMLPAVGQGALGIECRLEDTVTLERLKPLNDPMTRAAVDAERAFLRTMQAGCQAPVGAYSECTGDSLSLRGIILDPDGKEWLEGDMKGEVADADSLGVWLGQDLLSRGAARLMPKS
jgi:hydroxymethylbilane synthase